MAGSDIKEIQIMNNKTMDWLLEGEPWVEYRTRMDLLKQSETHPQVSAARRVMLAEPKIKALLDVLSHFEWVRKDKRFKQMLTSVETKANADGHYVPESIWTAWKEWDFSQKKVPSRGLTFFVQRILQRVSAV
jgi:hypothetical protein